MRTWLALVAVALAMVIAAPARAQPAPPLPTTPAPDPQAGAFDEASARLLAGDLAGARAAYEAVVAADPRGPWAPQALLEAGSVAERQGELAAARALYRRVLDEHPQARASRLAEVRLATLEAAGGPGGRWDVVAAEHERIVRAAAAGDGGARQAMASLLEQSLGYPRWVPAAIWLADASVRANDDLMAAIWYRRARVAASTADERFRAGLGEAGGWRVIGELRRARATLVGLDPPDAVAAGAKAQAIAAIDRSLAQRAWAWVARGVLVAAVLAGAIVLRRRRGSWRGAGRALWPPPIEVAYALPVAATMVFIAETGNPLAARAAEIILVGAVVVGWASGAVLRAAGPRPARAVVAVHLAVVLAVTLSIIYLTVIREGLWDLLVETWRNGPDGR